ncbi:PPM-type phosphatase [Gracilaria domingensis]|nr:PPM-type phosphatase [Gracilaria domingensis]
MIELAAHTIPLDDDAPMDHTFTRSESPALAIVDYAEASANGPLMLEYIRHRMSRSHLYGPHQPQSDLRAILAAALSAYGSPPSFSALLVDTAHDFLHIAWVGSCGFVVVRDDAIVYRSYGDRLGRPALEHALEEAGDSRPLHTTSTATPLTPDSLAARKRPHRDTVSTSDIHVDYFSLQDNDLVIAGTDGFFSNVSERQILAFVRPVPDAEDPTLAIANATCLGSWRYDDAHFISYYLAIIAANFATATNSEPYLPFPFPPSPHLDDVTVACISCSFAM